MMAPLVYLFIWTAVAGDGTVGSFGRRDFVFYYITLIVVNQATYPTSHWTVGENIHAGTLSAWLLRPLPVIFEAIASDIALKVVCLPFILVFAGIFAVLLDFGAALEIREVIPAAASFAMACMLRFLAAYTLSLLALWTQRINSLLAVNNTLVFLLAGQVAPTILLPGVFRDIAFFLPFRYMLGFPVEVLSGKLTLPEIISGLAVQASWLALCMIVQRLVWRSGIRRYTAIGG